MTPLGQALVVALVGTLVFLAYPLGELVLTRVRRLVVPAAEEQAPPVGSERPPTVAAVVGSAAVPRPEPSLRRDLIVAGLLGVWLAALALLLAVLS